MNALPISVSAMDCDGFSQLLAKKTGVHIDPASLTLLKSDASYTPQTKSTADPYWEAVSETRLQVEASIGGTESPRKVLYLLSGWDAGLPATFFPHSTVNIGSAMVPFVPSMPYPNIPFSLEPGTPWVHTNTVIQTPLLAAKILGSLKSALPEMRVRDVFVFERKRFRETQRPPIEDQLDGVAQNDSLDFWSMGGGIHGAIKYDTGEGTPERWYFHFDVYIDSQRPNWFDALQTTPDALIVKASAGCFGSRNQPHLVRGLTNHLIRVGGTLLEGRHDVWHSDGFEFSGTNPAQNGKSYLFDIPFGYMDYPANRGAGQVIRFSNPN